MWLVCGFLLLICASHQDTVDALVQKYRDQATREYLAEEHGDQKVFVSTSVYMGLHHELEKLLQSSQKKMVQIQDIGKTVEGHLVLAGAKFREQAALSGIRDDHKPAPFSKDEIECSDIAMHPLAYAGYKKCSPVARCFRKHVPNFPGYKDFDGAFQAQKAPIVLTRKTGESFRAEYDNLQDLAMRMKEATIKEVGSKARSLYFVSAALEDSIYPVSVDSVKAVGVDYTAVYLFDGVAHFQNQDGNRVANAGLVIFTSGIENKLKLSGKRLHLRFSCNSDFGDESLAERLARKPGKGKLTKTAMENFDWRQWFIFLFVIVWMFRF